MYDIGEILDLGFGFELIKPPVLLSWYAVVGVFCDMYVVCVWGAYNCCVQFWWIVLCLVYVVVGERRERT